MSLFFRRQLLLALLSLGLLSLSFRSPTPPPTPCAVYGFLAETCPVSQQATLPRRELPARYAARRGACASRARFRARGLPPPRWLARLCKGSGQH